MTFPRPADCPHPETHRGQKMCPDCFYPWNPVDYEEMDNAARAAGIKVTVEEGGDQRVTTYEFPA